MALHYKKITEEEDQVRNVLEKGQYPFSVKSVMEKPTSKKDNHMLEVEIRVMGNDGREYNVKDWIVTTMEEMAWKFRHFAATCGLLDRYEAEVLEARDFLGKNGVVKLTISEYEKDGEMRKVNRVADYVKPLAKEKKNDNSFVDDDIPSFV
ncbi:hypothetical protein KW791_00125 [Candidatus Parcubacteria bacterium]|nr:hypothetical protein [Candidatus Parcubacteria bacterium]